MKKFVIAMCAILPLVSCDISKKEKVPSPPAPLLGSELNEMWQNGSIADLTGMTKFQVKSMIGPPYNLESEGVWIWPTKRPRSQDLLGWRDIINDGSSIYIVFEDDKAIASIKADVNADPAELYSSIKGIAESEVPSEFRIEIEPGDP